MNHSDPKDSTVPLPPPASASHWEPATRFYRQIHIAALGLLIFVLLVYLFREFAAILQELFIAAFITYLIFPAHRWLVRHGVPSFVAYLCIVLGVVALFWFLGTILYSNLEDLNDKLPAYRENLGRMIRQVSEQVPGLDAGMLQRLVAPESSSTDKTFGLVRSALGAFFGFLSQMFVVLVYLAFILADRAGFDRRIEAAFEPQRARDIRTVIDGINIAIENYIVVKTFMSFLTGVSTTVVLLAFGVDYAILWGVVAFLLNYIPYLGSVVAVVLPLLLSLVQLQSPQLTLVVLVLLLIVHSIIGFVVEPFMAGRRLHLSPLVILLALAFWGSLWGITGMILAVPLVAVVMAILESIKETRPIAVLLTNA
jgi:predicted PurR-regulated permease PerM